ncbi:hypothetical protein EDD22DRAFT_898077 [Suillus occidentalis]|nr:hypothetical protein EDD22DRAFT_898077 [Suillus occidentalis]
MRAISLHCEALTLCPLGDPFHDYTLNNLALALQTRYDKLDNIEDINEAISLHRESIRSTRLDDLECHKNLHNLSLGLCSCFAQPQKNEDAGEAIRLCHRKLCLHCTRIDTLAT